jgi:ribose transport system ATP-binding protein/rhamnose transport system ATP-binding protein
MTGSEQLTEQAREALEAADRRGALALTARGLLLRVDGRPIDVDVHAGELVGVAGLEGHGQEQFLDALRGAGAIAGEIVRHEGGREVALRSPSHAARHGVAYVPRERRQSLFGWMSIRENFAMPTLRRDSWHGFLRMAATRRRLAEYVKRLSIVLREQGDPVTTLSGGNQQKVVIGRWLASEPRVLLLNDPTRGVDVGAKRDLYALLTHLADEGLAVVMLSTELDEHVELMDRVLVFREHELFREIERASLSRQALVSAFFGEQEEPDGVA